MLDIKPSHKPAKEYYALLEQFKKHGVVMTMFISTALTILQATAVWSQDTTKVVGPISVVIPSNKVDSLFAERLFQIAKEKEKSIWDSFQDWMPAIIGLLAVYVGNRGLRNVTKMQARVDLHSHWLKETSELLATMNDCVFTIMTNQSIIRNFLLGFSSATVRPLEELDRECGSLTRTFSQVSQNYIILTQLRGIERDVCMRRVIEIARELSNMKRIVDDRVTGDDFTNSMNRVSDLQNTFNEAYFEMSERRQRSAFDDSLA